MIHDLEIAALMIAVAVICAVLLLAAFHKDDQRVDGAPFRISTEAERNAQLMALRCPCKGPHLHGPTEAERRRAVLYDDIAARRVARGRR